MSGLLFMFMLAASMNVFLLTSDASSSNACAGWISKVTQGSLNELLDDDLMSLGRQCEASSAQIVAMVDTLKSAMKPVDRGGMTFSVDVEVPQGNNGTVRRRLTVVGVSHSRNQPDIRAEFGRNNQFAVKQAKVAHILMQETLDYVGNPGIDNYLYDKVMSRQSSTTAQLQHYALDQGVNQGSKIHWRYQNWEKIWRPTINQRKQELGLSDIDGDAIHASDVALHIGDYRIQSLIESLSVISDRELGQMGQNDVDKRFAILQTERNSLWAPFIVKHLLAANDLSDSDGPEANGIIIVVGRHHLFSHELGLLGLLEQRLRESAASFSGQFEHKPEKEISSTENVAKEMRHAQKALSIYLSDLQKIHQQIANQKQ